MEVPLTRSVLTVLIGSMTLFGCANPELEQKVADLEAKVAELEKRPAAAMPAGAANPEAESKAAELLKAATKASEEGNYDEAKKKLAELKSKFGSTRAAKAAARLDSELAVIGKAAGGMEVEKWFQGDLASLDEGTTLLVFWEVWCPHCKREVPKLAETFNKFNGKGLNMVGLTKMTRDISEEQVKSFLADNKVNYPIAKEKGDSMSQHFGVRGIPAAAVVKNGKVVWRGHPARLNDQMIEGWL
jgi:thioredoxin-like negative regulator of GroEL